MDSNELRRLAGLQLNEGIGDTVELNQQLNTMLDQSFPNKEERLIALDILDVLKSTGSEGISPPTWLKQVLTLHHVDKQVMIELIKLTIRKFTHYVHKDNGKFFWVETGDAEDKVNIQHQLMIYISHFLSHYFNKPKKFSINNVAKVLSNHFSIPEEMAKPIVHNYIEAHHTKFNMMDDDVGMVNAERGNTRDENMNNLRNIASRKYN